MIFLTKYSYPADDLRRIYGKDVSMELLGSASPVTGNISASVYIIIGIIAAVVIIITAVAGIIGKKNKK